MNQNMHIHSKYSWDSKMEIETIAENLYQNGIKYGAITDHIEFDREPLAEVLIKFKIRNEEIDKINEIYKGKVKLIKAAEISEPHLYKDKVESLSELNLDFIMGSIHKIDKTAITPIEKKHVKYRYYKELLKMVKANQIDVVAHLDYVDRYYGYGNDDPYQINEILHAIRENDQIIEINTSGDRRCGLNVFPNVSRISTYCFGKKEIIIGTDAHEYNELTDNLKQAELIKKEFGLQPVIYEKRKRIIL